MPSSKCENRNDCFRRPQTNTPFPGESTQNDNMILYRLEHSWTCLWGTWGFALPEAAVRPKGSGNPARVHVPHSDGSHMCSRGPGVSVDFSLGLPLETGREFSIAFGPPPC